MYGCISHRSLSKQHNMQVSFAFKSLLQTEYKSLSQALVSCVLVNMHICTSFNIYGHICLTHEARAYKRDLYSVCREPVKEMSFDQIYMIIYV